jgi:N-acetyl-gamma-glutamyl-phosphate reductase
MKAVTGLENAPVFCPIVSDFYSGMEVTVPLFQSQIRGDIEEIRKIYQAKYQGEIVRYVESADEGGFLSGNKLARKDGMQITVCGNEERILLIALYDNLGKGASGAAIECMNAVLGVDSSTGLEL